MSNSSEQENIGATLLLVIVGIFLGIGASVLFGVSAFVFTGVVLTLLKVEGWAGLENFMILIIPFAAMLAIVYYVLSQKPKGIILGLMIGGALGLLLNGMCNAVLLNL
ncbi:MAG: hypothetical protein ACK41G_05580 [Candidatus Thermochlorobacter sp.]